MTETISIAVHAALSAIHHGLHIFTDGCFEPKSGNGGWAYLAYRDGTEVASDCGGVRDTANNAMEIMALLQAALWLGTHAEQQPAVIWSDSLYAVRGCNELRPIWKSNGWKKLDPNPRSRRRTIPDVGIWKAIDLQLSQNPQITVAWCKGHIGIDGNERADALAERGRRSIEKMSRHDLNPVADGRVRVRSGKTG